MSVWVKRLSAQKPCFSCEVTMLARPSQQRLKTSQKYQLLRGDSTQAIMPMLGVNSWRRWLLKSVRSSSCLLSLSAESMAVVPHVPRAVKWWGLAHYLPSLCQFSTTQQLHTGRHPWKLKAVSHDLGKS